MRNFIVSYYSENNIFKGHVHVSAMTVSEAQDKFLDWLREQQTYPYLYHLSFNVQEIGESL